MSLQRAARLHGPRDLRIDELPVPVAGPTEVVVAIDFVGICGSDVHFYDSGRIGPTVVDRPLVLGHEPSGTVVAVGERVSRLSVGQRVSLEPGVPCGSCRSCLVGRYNLCAEIAFFAFPPTDGALAEYVAISEDFAHPVPQSISDEAAALIEPLAVAIWALRSSGVGLGTRVNVTGAGPIGLLCSQVAQLAGGDVTISDPRPQALDVARRYGARDVVLTRTDRLPIADLHVDCSGNPSAIIDGIDALEPGGRSILVGVGPDRVEIPLTSLRRRELTVTSTFRYAHVYPTAISLVDRGLIDLDGLVTDRYDLADCERAFASALAPAGDRHTIKALVRVAG